MHRNLIIASAILAVAAPAAAAPTSAAPPNPVSAKTTQQVGDPARFTNPVNVRVRTVTSTSAGACNRRAVGVSYSAGAMSVNGASDSRTLIAAPIGGGSISSATTQQQITEVCDHN